MRFRAEASRRICRHGRRGPKVAGGANTGSHGGPGRPIEAETRAEGDIAADQLLEAEKPCTRMAVVAFSEASWYLDTFPKGAPGARLIEEDKIIDGSAELLEQDGMQIPSTHIQPRETATDRVRFYVEATETHGKIL
jgi:hypothetical protein